MFREATHFKDVADTKDVADMGERAASTLKGRGIQTRILHVDDDDDVREIVELCLEADPVFDVVHCGNAADALRIATDWMPHLILCDVTLPVMNGPAFLRRLRETTKTANIPVVFMTGCTQKNEIDYFMSLGVAGIIRKPFDPMTLAGSMRGFSPVDKVVTVRKEFSKRLWADATTLEEYRNALSHGPLSSNMRDEMQSCVHKLAGAAGIYGFSTVSCEASKLENLIVDKHRVCDAPTELGAQLDRLLTSINHELPEERGLGQRLGPK